MEQLTLQLWLRKFSISTVSGGCRTLTKRCEGFAHGGDFGDCCNTQKCCTGTYVSCCAIDGVCCGSSCCLPNSTCCGQNHDKCCGPGLVCSDNQYCCAPGKTKHYLDIDFFVSALFESRFERCMKYIPQSLQQ